MFLCLMLASLSAHGQRDKPAYTIFAGNGKSVSYHKMMKDLEKADVVFFGELHNNSVGHWLELQVLKDLYAANVSLVLGLEMFEADTQIILDEYLNEYIDERNFLNEARPWDNYKTDYRPLVEFARQKKLRVIATNVPRRYANRVYRKGPGSLDSLSTESKRWMSPPPLQVDYSLPGYQAMLEGMQQHGAGSAENLVASQALKDATMAHFIRQHVKPGGVFYHINGAYHTQDREGIIAYLAKSDPRLKIITIHTTEQEEVGDLVDDVRSKGDYILCIPSDMTKTY